MEMNLGQLTVRQLDNITSKVGSHHIHGPVFFREETKTKNMARLQRWIAKSGGTPALAELERLVESALQERGRIQEVRSMTSPMPGTRFITRQEMEALPSYRYIYRAITLPHSSSVVAAPYTKDGHLSVDAIYNMLGWAGWKSSSLDPDEMAIASAIHGLPMGELLELNHGRRGNQPAFFPAALLETLALPVGRKELT